MAEARKQEMLKRGGEPELILLFDRAIKLEVGEHMRTFIKSRVSGLFETPEGIETRQGRIRAWNTDAIDNAKTCACPVHMCLVKPFKDKHGLATHMLRNHTKIVNATLATEKSALANQSKEWQCNVKKCYISYDTEAQLKKHFRRNHHFKV